MEDKPGRCHEGEPFISLDFDLLEVVLRLRNVLAQEHGKIRVADVQALAGFYPPTDHAMSLVGRAMNCLGWTRRRCRFDGVLNYGYTRGTPLQREVILDIGYGDRGVFVVRRSSSVRRTPLGATE